MSKSKNAKKSSKFGLIFKIFIAALVAGGWYAYQNPSVLPPVAQDILIEYNLSSQSVELSSATQPVKNSILGKTTSIVEEGLQSLKVPKQLTGQEEVDLQEVVDNFSQKVQNLPTEQVDRLKIQFCQDLLNNVPNVSVQVTE